MIYSAGLAGLAELCLVVFCVLEVVTTPEDRIRNLPKLLWLALVVLVPIIGPVSWLIAGRPQGPARSLPYKGNTGLPPARPSTRSSSPDDDADFLEGLRRRAEEQRRRARDEDPPA